MRPILTRVWATLCLFFQDQDSCKRNQVLYLLNLQTVLIATWLLYLPRRTILGVPHPSCICRCARRVSTAAPATRPLLRPPRVSRRSCRVPILCLSCVRCCARCCTPRYDHRVPVVASVVTPVISDLRTWVLGDVARTYRASRFAAAAAAHQPNDDELRSGVLTLFTRGDEHALSSQSMVLRGAVSRCCIACRMQMATGRDRRQICSARVGREISEHQTKKVRRALTRWKPQREGHVRTRRERHPSDGQELVRDKHGHTRSDREEYLPSGDCMYVPWACYLEPAESERSRGGCGIIGLLTMNEQNFNVV